MKGFQLRFSALIVLLSFLSLQFESCKAKNKDADIQTAINSKTATDANLAGVSATVLEGVVTLTGNCADENCRTNAESSIKSVAGVKKVVNNIMIAQVTVTPDDPLRTSVDDVVKRYDNVQASVSSGVITLRGQMERDKLQQLMMDLNALQPKRIDNQLVLK